MLVDAHLHLDQYPAEEIERLIEEWVAFGVEKVVAVSTNLASSYSTLEWKQKYPHFIYAAVGYHPEQNLPAQEEIDELLRLIKQERDLISAIGEIGLPYYTRKERTSSLEEYIDLLHVFLDQAAREDLPAILHAVHEHAQLVLNLLVKNNVHKAHFHWLKAPVDVVQQIIAAGYYISVTPEVCYRQRDQHLVKSIPVRHLLLETDGPWPFSDKFSQQRTTPKMIQEVAKQVAQLKGIELSALLKQCHKNVSLLWGNIS